MSKHLTSGGRSASEEVACILSKTVEDKRSGCLEWVGSLNSDGYPKLARKNSQTGATDFNVKGHRYLYELYNGVRLQVGEVVRHVCDNPICLNPNHLLVGTNHDNMVDRSARGRTHGHVHNSEIQLVKDALVRGVKLTTLSKNSGLNVKRLYYIHSRYIKLDQADA